MASKFFTKFLLTFFLVTLVGTNGSFAATNSCHSYFEKRTFSLSFSTLTQEKKIKYLKTAIKIPLVIALSAFAWKQFDQHYFWPKAEATVASQILNQTEKHTAFYDDLILHDFRFRNIRNITYDPEAVTLDARLKKVDAQKRVMTYNTLQNYKIYYETFNQIENPKSLTLEQHVELFGQSPLFQHLNFFFANGVREYEGSRVSKEDLGPLTNQQKELLFELTHELYAKYLVIDLLYSKRTDYRTQQIEDSIIAEEIKKSSYTQKLLTLETQGLITRDQLIYYLHEDAYNSYYFSVFETLKITNLKHDKPDVPLTLTDLRNSRLSSTQY